MIFSKWRHLISYKAAADKSFTISVVSSLNRAKWIPNYYNLKPKNQLCIHDCGLGFVLFFSPNKGLLSTTLNGYYWGKKEPKGCQYTLFKTTKSSMIKCIHIQTKQLRLTEFRISLVFESPISFFRFKPQRKSGCLVLHQHCIRRISSSYWCDDVVLSYV